MRLITLFAGMQLALQTVWSPKMRSFLTVLGVIIGTGTIIDRLNILSLRGDCVQEALWRQGAHMYCGDFGFAEQTLDDRLEVGLVGDDSVVFVVHRGVGAIGEQDARTGGQLLG